MAEPKKVVYDVCIHDDKGQLKVMKAIASIKGIQSIHIDMNGSKLTVVGVFDLVCGIKKLRKVCKTEILVVEIVKEEEKKEEPKKEEPKEEPQKEDEKKDGNENTKMWINEPNYSCMPQHYRVIMEEHPNCCVIC